MGKIILILGLLLTPHSILIAEKPQGLDISLISEVKAITAGKPFTVGLHIRHHKGFHTYWQNPGIVGMATAIEWKLPPGFTAQPIQWPYPELTTMASHPCHGYERDVTLLVTITPPKKLPNSPINLTAKTRWMCCAKDCYPGFKDFTLTLPVSVKPSINPQSAKLIQKARTEIPKSSADWKTTLLSKPDAPTIRLQITPPNKSVVPTYLFSTDGQISSDQKQTFTPQPNGSFLIHIPRSEFSPQHKTSLPAIIATGDQFIAICPSYPSKDKTDP